MKLTAKMATLKEWWVTVVKLTFTEAYSLSLPFLSQNVKKFVERIRAYKRLNLQIFGILNKHLASSDVLAKPVREFQPPIY